MTHPIHLERTKLDELLFQTLRSVYQFERAKVVHFGLTYEGIYLLQFLRRRSPLKMGDIAEEMKIPISTATRVVDRLHKKRLVSRRKDPTDRRQILVSLDGEGEKIVHDVEDHTFQILMQNLDHFTAEDVTSFILTASNLNLILNTTVPGNIKKPSIQPPE
jgi:DNA-binding MarR family transcriptional regulator